MSLPLVTAKDVRLMRSIELYCKIDNNSWINNLLYYGFYPMKLYTARVANKVYPVGCMQSITLTLDDLLVDSAFASAGYTDVGPDQWRSRFTKGLLHSIKFSLNDSAAPMLRAGRYAMSFIWFSEVEALEANRDLGHKQMAVLPDLKTFFSSPGVSVAPATSGLTREWLPPSNSWVRDYVRIGRSEGRGSGSSWGLPVGRLLLGFQNLSTLKMSGSYDSKHFLAQLTISARVTLAEMGARLLRKQFESEYDSSFVGVYSELGYCELPQTDILDSLDAMKSSSDDFVVV